MSEAAIRRGWTLVCFGGAGREGGRERASQLITFGLTRVGGFSCQKSRGNVRERLSMAHGLCAPPNHWGLGREPTLPWDGDTVCLAADGKITTFAAT